MTPSIGVLISGRGSNLRAIIAAIEAGTVRARIAVVIANKTDAAGLDAAKAAGLPTVTMLARDFPSRDAFDQAVAGTLVQHGVSLVCLAGFMRLVGAPLLEAFPNRILNIHPSLLPAFPGLDAQQQALDYGVAVSGATVHFVNADLDGGTIIAQAVVPVHDTDTVDVLSARILEQEHRLYPAAIATVLAGGWRIDGRRFVAAPERASDRTRGL